MSKNIYLVYDSNIEDTASIDRFLQILSKAGYDVLESVLPITSESFEELLEKETPNFAICLNKTFKDFSITYSDKLEVPIFEFFSKEYLNKDLKICITGLLLNIQDIFNPAYKRYAWDILNTFLKNYNDILPLLNVTEETSPVEEEVQTASADETESEDYEEDFFCSYLDDNPPPKKEVKQDPVVVEQKTEEVVTQIVETPVHEATTIEDESLKDFYLNVKQLISQFNLVQDQLKQIENKFSAS